MVKEVTGGTSPFTRPALSVPNIFFGKIRTIFSFVQLPSHLLEPIMGLH